MYWVKRNGIWGWEYTGDESAALNARHFARVKAHKCVAECHVSGCDLFERKPLWEIMGRTEEDWQAEHDRKMYPVVD